MLLGILWALQHKRRAKFRKINISRLHINPVVFGFKSGFLTEVLSNTTGQCKQKRKLSTGGKEVLELILTYVTPRSGDGLTNFRGPKIYWCIGDSPVDKGVCIFVLFFKLRNY